MTEELTTTDVSQSATRLPPSNGASVAMFTLLTAEQDAHTNELKLARDMRRYWEAREADLTLALGSISSALDTLSVLNKHSPTTTSVTRQRKVKVIDGGLSKV